MISLHKSVVGAFAATAMFFAVGTASAATLDFSAQGLTNGGVVSDSVGDVAGVVDFTYRSLTLGGGWAAGAVQSSTDMLYASSGYSGDGAIIGTDPANTLDGNVRGEVTITALGSNLLSSVSFDIGRSDDKQIRYSFFDGTSWSGVQIIATGTSLVNIALSLVQPVSEIKFIFGNNTHIGLTAINYEMSNQAVSAVPVPGALMLLGSALAGVFGMRSMRRKTA